MSDSDLSNLSLRSELRAIQTELRKPFPASAHQIRELPGGGYWAFVPHQTIRLRLDEVCPEWQTGFSQMEIVGDNIVCRCGITILGIRKESVGSVPLIAASNKYGKDVSRGSAADRVTAEALKNAAEMWGVGVYLDDQAFVANHLSKGSNELDDERRAKLRSLIAHLRTKGEMPSPNSSVSMSGVPRTEKPTINPKVMTPPPPQTQPLIEKSPANRDSLMKEIDSLCKRRGVDASRGKTILIDLYGVRGRSQLTDAQLISFRDYLQAIKQPQPVN